MLNTKDWNLQECQRFMQVELGILNIPNTLEECQKEIQKRLAEDQRAVDSTLTLLKLCEQVNA